LGQVPPFSFQRGWARIGFFVELAVGLLAAGGLSVLLQRLRERFGARAASRQAALAAGALALVTLDGLAIPFGMAPVVPRPVEAWLAGQPGKFSVMEYPVMNHAYGGRAMYARRLTGKSIVMGYGSFPPNFASWPLLSLFPSTP